MNKIVNFINIEVSNYFDKIIKIVKTKFNKDVDITFGFETKHKFQPISGCISFMVPDYYGEDLEGVILDFVTQYTPLSLNPVITSDFTKKEILYVSCDVDNVQNEDFYRELILKDNDNLQQDVEAMLIELEAFIMSKADLIVYIINDLYPLPLVKNSDEA